MCRCSHWFRTGLQPIRSCVWVFKRFGSRNRPPEWITFEFQGKDKIIFVTKEDHETPSNAELVADDPNDPYEDHGLILPNGDINWNCPCLGGMASGPCGEQFKSAFSCFHYSKEEIKGSDCVDQFRAMQECMQKYPELYPQEDDDDEDDEEKQGKALEAAAASVAKEEEKGSS
ncbi:mitochondrial intermembrane space import and assembly protein 40 isoform X1 [Zootoca vivipara]|uniref:mitochondrial intermembrane space import and assembly protein 40 isoform X1 n=1 Tax=Zootoca vivipara TaxID=8524 RepID=UPI00159193DE|nr:mitochondrial intermembrane space import and assembly protein 40 isoform X1 [Zootoca vivipara]XP_034962393.1 mitochondrial intermembrane space import and assembly protein 40 isoform X1 [Zootoca vivipara]XP_060127376.1 mitochondrial intermembrane space import and assembly protein 40 isoform X1 [Zootoca vivipara]